MPSSSASRRMVRAPAPSSSRIEKAVSMICCARGEREVPVGRAVGSVGSIEAEHRVLRRDRRELVVGAVGADAVEELPDLELPTAQVRTQDLDLVLVGDLMGDVVRALRAEEQIEVPIVGAHVADPLAVAAWGDEVVDAVD